MPKRGLHGFWAGLLALLLVLLVGAAVTGEVDARNPLESAPRAAALGAQEPSSVSRQGCARSRRSPGGADPWGGCWPGPRNTGVPGSVRLRQVSGNRTVTRDGAVIDGWDVDGCIVVGGLGVTIKNSRARCITLESGSRARYCHPSEGAAARDLTECTVVPGLSDSPRAGKPRLRVRASTIDCQGEPGATGTGLGDRNLRIVRVDIRDCENGLDADAFVTVKHSYIHDLYNSSIGDPHTDGLQSALGHRIRLVHNVIFAFTSGCTYPDSGEACNGTSAVGLATRARNTRVSRNMLAGGAYTMYCPGASASGLRITKNRFSEVYSPHVGEYGPMTDCSSAGITRRGNRRLHY